MKIVSTIRQLPKVMYEWQTVGQNFGNVKILANIATIDQKWMLFFCFVAWLCGSVAVYTVVHSAMLPCPCACVDDT